MSPEMILGVLTGLLALTTGLVGFLTKITSKVDTKIDEVHILVNDRMTEALTRIEQLSDALAGAGVEIPDSPRRSG